jgi:DNA polymerase I-like protein with 3'-5' exonuclease and polymerase domains
VGIGDGSNPSFCGEQLKRDWIKEENELKKQIVEQYAPKGVRADFSVWDATILGKIFAHNNLNFPITPKTRKPSFKQEWLKDHPSKLGKMIFKARRAQKASNTFIDKMILGNMYRGRIHCDWYPLKTESDAESGLKGTVSGRYGAGNPSLQVMPSVEKTPELGKKIRRLFLPEEGCNWNSSDYSQQEPRWAVHYAHLLKLPGAAEAVERYRTGDVDFHTMMAEDAGIERPKAKIINLGILYGEGAKKICFQLRLEESEGKALLERYHERVPWLKGLFSACSKRAGQNGFIRTYYGRMCRFDRWEPMFSYEEMYDASGERKRVDSLSYDEAVAAVNNPALEDWYNRGIRRAFTHKALNRLAQGSSADQMKLAMRELGRNGLIPAVQMHDELCNSTQGDKEDKLIADIMRDVVRISVPFKIDVEIGRSWGEVQKMAA